MLTANQNIYFSRYLASAIGKEVFPPPRSLLRPLVLISNLIDLGEYGLETVDVEGEIQRARMHLKRALVTSLPTGKDTRASFLEMVRPLQTGCDILYIVAHGAIVENQAWLWLEDDSGRTHRISGADLAAQVSALERPPLLVVLAFCESAGNGERDARLALIPLICSAGVAAVIAMQGKFSMQTAMRGMLVFLERLIEDCRADRALAAMRTALSAGGTTDMWMPALFLRLKDGSICQLAEAPAPPALRNLWSQIDIHFQGKPAAEAAIEDLLWDAIDLDNQAAFGIQLKKVLRDDQDFANQLLAEVEGYLHASGKEKPGGISINVGGNVEGSILIGKNNTVSS